MRAAQGVVTDGRDPQGTEVLSAFERVDPPGWRVFVEEPLSEAFAPIQAAIWRTVALLVVFLLVAIATSVLLARNLARPIEAIQVAAAKIGSGSLDQRIDASSRDELGALADEFNRMAARLEASHAGLEQQVEERTRELASALAELDEKTRELEAASRHKSEFLANMSHELRTPLNAISGFSQVLRKQLFGEINEKQAEYLDDILASSRHLLSLIDDVLDLSKVEAGQIELQVAPFSLPEALERGVVIVRERATRGGVRDLAVVGSRASTRSSATSAGSCRSIFNLLSNAVKFTPAGGTVDVAAARRRRRGARVRQRHGTGHRPGGPGPDLRGVPAGRRGQGAGRGDRPRAGAVEAPHRAARRTDLGRQRAGTGQHVRVHAARATPHSRGTASRSSSSRTTRRT